LDTAQNTKGFHEICQINLLSLSTLALAISADFVAGLLIENVVKETAESGTYIVQQIEK
jgi:hypothetical protein